MVVLFIKLQIGFFFVQKIVSVFHDKVQQNPVGPSEPHLHLVLAAAPGLAQGRRVVLLEQLAHFRALVARGHGRVGVLLGHGEGQPFGLAIAGVVQADHNDVLQRRPSVPVPLLTCVLQRGRNSAQMGRGAGLDQVGHGAFPHQFGKLLRIGLGPQREQVRGVKVLSPLISALKI